MTAAPARSAGRPLDSQRDDAILTATLELVGEVGYDRMSIEGVAGRAQTGKTTIYRRWSDKAELMVAAVAALACRTCEYPDTGSVRGDLLAAMQTMSPDDPASDLPIMLGVMTAAARNPALAAALHEQMGPVKRAAAELIITRAIGRGELPAGANKELFHEIGWAMVLNRVLSTGQAPGDEFLAHVVDDVLLPLLTRT